jgi:peptide/nickel transport system substrate-binding protein
MRPLAAMDFDDNIPDTKTGLTETLTKKRSIPFLSKLEALPAAFSPAERLALYLLSAVLAVCATLLLAGLSNYISVQVPMRGGTLTEGDVGPVRFINPLLTLSGADEDLTQLVYSGLMRALPDGTYVPDLASSYDISEDGTTYTFHLRPNATFQDGTPVTAADVLYTVQEAQDPDIRSPRQADWTGVQVQAPDDHTIVFTLPHAYAPFIENTTMGILPKHLWQNVAAAEYPFSPLNTHPVGSGPYAVKAMATDPTGSITSIDLVPFEKFTLGAPYLQHIHFNFYSNEDDVVKALDSGAVDAAAGISPSQLKNVTRRDVDLATVALPRVFGVFFNQNHASVLADAGVREALNAAIDKQQTVNGVLGGYGETLDGPLPPGVTGTVTPASPAPLTASAPLMSASSTPNADNIQNAHTILQQDGWSYDQNSNTWTKKKEPLSFTLATADQTELLATANQVVSAWKALGVQVTLQVYPLSEFNSTILRPRSYDAVLFGEVVGRSVDLFAFWHSSQRNDPGLNLAMYANSHADTLLSQERAETEPHARAKLYDQFTTIVQKDQPAVFLFSPEFLYLVPDSIHGLKLGALTSPSERFLNVYQWYATTTGVWDIFTNQ